MMSISTSFGDRLEMLTKRPLISLPAHLSLKEPPRCLKH
jgi:hypothetical protein